VNKHSSPYSAALHFRDGHLFDLFMEEIPDGLLRDQLRRSQALRNRTFPGFRITKAVPGNQQIRAAFKKEIVDRGNGELARFLSESWIKHHPAIAKEGATHFGESTSDATDLEAWANLTKVADDNNSLEKDSRSAIRSLVKHYSADVIQIFVSIISLRIDQHIVQQIMKEELNADAKQLSSRKARLMEAKDQADASINQAEKAKVELQDTLEKLINEASTESHALIENRDRVGRTLTELRQSLESISTNIDQLIEQKAIVSEGCKSSEKEQQSILKLLAEREARFASAKVQLLLQREAADESIKTQIAHKAALDQELSDIGESFKQAIQQPRAEQVGALEDTNDTQPLAKESTEELQHADDAGPLGINAICYQGIQRIFRNAIVIFLRTRMTAVFPQDYLSKLKKPFGGDWAKAESHANTSRSTLGTTTSIKDDFDLLGTNHFFNIFDSYFNDLFPEAATDDHPKPVKVRFIGNLKAIKDSRDPLSHPVEEEVPLEEAQHLLYCAQEVLKWVACKNEADQLASLADQINDLRHDEQSTLRRLPSEDGIYLEFVGRDSLMHELTICFSNPLNKRCLLAGDGGKGKSAAAYKFVRDLPPSIGRYSLILWLSAKQRRFSDGSSTRIETPDFSNIGEAVDRILQEYGATSEDLTKDFANRKTLLFEYLNDLPAFIVADDIDSVLEDDEVVGLFTHEIPHTHSTVLLTSRRSIPGIRTFNVPGFDPSEATEFIESRIRLYDLDKTSFSPSTLKRIIESTDGSPLYMDDLLRLSKTLSLNQAITIWKERGGDEARKYALQREVEKLSQDGRSVLVAAAVQEEPISFAELRDILGFNEERLVSALLELQTLFLFPKAPAVEGEQRYQINLNTKKLVRIVEEKNAFYSRIENQSKALAGKLPTVQQGVVASLIRQAMLRFNADQQNDAEKILLGAITKYPHATDLYGVLGFMYRRMGRIADATTYFETAYKLKSKNVETYLHWVKMEIAEKEWSKAISAADKAVKLIPDAYEIIERKIYAQRQGGFDLHRGLHHEKARRMWSDAVEEVTRSIRSPETLATGARACNASMYQSVVICLDMLSRFRERNRWFDRWQREHPDDPNVESQREFLIKKRGSLLAGA
jgi:tetratricopeptide (TPR) repeat protein